MDRIEIPENQRTIPWVQSLVDWIEAQSKTIQEQSKTIQAQAEQLDQFKSSIQDLRDEIARLKNTPKRPKFRSSGKPSSSKDKERRNVTNRQAADAAGDSSIQKTREEIVVKPLGVPEGSRFKGYTTYAIQELTITPAAYIRVVDTGAKHCYENGYCTHIGGEYFAYYKTTNSKSRANFLRILAQGEEGYVINTAFIWHLFHSGVEADILNLFETQKEKRYRGHRGFIRLLNKLGIRNKKIRCICIEAGLVGWVQERLKPNQVLISDRAGQFAILNHAECWVHMERPLRKLVASTPEVELEICQVREAIWSLYDQVKAASLSQQGKEKVFVAYDALVARSVVSPGVRAVLDAFRDHRDGLLKALDHPGLQRWYRLIGQK